ncbi:MAG: hypothetical protein ABR881_30740 [Candidatus Sulfotelmatobacter sp.]
MPCALAGEEAAGLSGDASTDIHALLNYKKTISRLLEERKFEQLDCLADSARNDKEIFPGGTWKLHTVYLGLNEPQLHATQKDWKGHIGRLKQWMSARPQSITAHIALAESYVNYGWEARGHGYVDTVSENGWKLFKERSAQGRQILKHASDLPQKCPEWYVAMQDVALAQGWDPSAKQALLEQAIKFDPDYFYYYRKYAVSILPEWDGAEGQLGRFLKTTADKIGGNAGDILYFQVASLVVCCQAEPLNFSWPRIQRGFDALEKQHGAALDNWNRMARMAAIYNDPVVANKMLARIGDQWSDEVWQTFPYFESVKNWAKQVVPMMDVKSPAEESAEANLQTADGRGYKTAFDEKIRTLLPGCVQESGTDLGSSKVLFRVGKDGTVDQVITVGPDRLGSCLLRKVSELAGKSRAVFPPPPKPDYWIRVDLDSAHSAMSGTK